MVAPAAQLKLRPLKQRLKTALVRQISPPVSQNVQNEGHSD
jgi:hypothetical protein